MLCKHNTQSFGNMSKYYLNEILSLWTPSDFNYIQSTLGRLKIFVSFPDFLILKHMKLSAAAGPRDPTSF